MTFYLAKIYLTVSGNTHGILNCAVEGIITNVKMQKTTYLKLNQYFLILEKTYYISIAIFWTISHFVDTMLFKFTSLKLCNCLKNQA